MKKVRITLLFLTLIPLSSFYSCGGDDESVKPEIVAETGLNGVWSGTGTSSLFPTPYAVTFDLVENEDVLSGKFYISSTTRAGFGGEDDGTFEADIVGDSLIDVKVSQILENIVCPRVFEGRDIFQDENTIRILWTGSDCSGFHDNGVFNLRKRG